MEERLGDIILALFIAINDARVAREEREAAERKRIEEERRREKLRKQYSQEVERTLALENEAEDYAMACKIRELVAAVEAKNNESESAQQWLIWAKAKADWYDPTISAYDAFFGKRKHSEPPERKTPTPGSAVHVFFSFLLKHGFALCFPLSIGFTFFQQ